MKNDEALNSVINDDVPSTNMALLAKKLDADVPDSTFPAPALSADDESQAMFPRYGS